MNRFAPERLHEFCRRVFESFGISRTDADQAADILIVADLRGIDTHGVARMKSYVDLIESGRVNPRPNIRIVRETPAAATVDGDAGLGMTVSMRANELAMEKAERVGAGWVSVCNTNHFGIAGYYPLEALKRDLIGFAMTNTTSIVAPLWGAQRRLGTNPIAVAFPALEEPPIVIDMATTSAAFGKVENAIRRGEPIPSGWAVDAAGSPTTNPMDVYNGGALLPMGSDKDRGGHKGYCLSAMVDLLCGPLSGANWGPFTPPFIMLKVVQERDGREGDRPLLRRTANRRLHRSDGIQTAGRRLDSHLPRDQARAGNRWPADSRRSGTPGRSRQRGRGNSAPRTGRGRSCAKSRSGRACRSSRLVQKPASRSSRWPPVGTIVSVLLQIAGALRWHRFR